MQHTIDMHAAEACCVAQLFLCQRQSHSLNTVSGEARPGPYEKLEQKAGYADPCRRAAYAGEKIECEIGVAGHRLCKSQCKAWALGYKFTYPAMGNFGYNCTGQCLNAECRDRAFRRWQSQKCIGNSKMKNLPLSVLEKRVEESPSLDQDKDCILLTAGAEQVLASLELTLPQALRLKCLNDVRAGRVSIPCIVGDADRT